jgi:hypothetical protein
VPTRRRDTGNVIDRYPGDVDNAVVVSGSQQVALLRALVVSERTLLEHPLYAADARAIILDAEREMAELGVAVGPGMTADAAPGGGPRKHP